MQFLLAKFEQLALVLLIEAILVLNEELLENGLGWVNLCRVHAMYQGILGGFLRLIHIAMLYRVSLTDRRELLHIWALSLFRDGDHLHAFISSLRE